MIDEEIKEARKKNQQCEAEMQKDIVGNASEKEKTAVEKGKDRKRQKKYYFLKLPSGFSGSDSMFTLYASAENKTEGLLMQFCYIRMLELSIKTEGTLRASVRAPYLPKTLALALGGFTEEIVSKVVSIMSDCGYITINDDATIVMNQLPELIASSSEQAIERRKERISQSQSDDAAKQSQDLIKLAKTQWLG